MNLPKRTDLPYFTYGLFKSTEPAHKQVAPFLEKSPARTNVKGSIFIRDGLPLLRVGGSEQVIGELLYFRQRYRDEAYGVISRFEPREHYLWGKVFVEGKTVLANCLVGRQMTEGNPSQFEANEWGYKNDPVFTEGLKVVADISKEYASTEFQNDPAHTFDWERLFLLQAAYLLLWSAIERYTALAYGPDLGPNERVNCLGIDAAFQGALKTVVSRTGEVVDSRDPAARKRLDPQDPKASIQYYYRVRSNLSHRGKGAYKDGEIIRRSLLELQDIFNKMLK
ncbi:MAG: hypothetical protein LAO31_13565 [Acidobacteriia bacterium]|nr:hypothetical protein [Terriglobia bacterium]